jgi:hypothetical protein
MSTTEQAREMGVSWERLPEPRPRVTLELFTPSGQEQVFYLGPHAPRLTPKEIDLLHKIWLQLSDRMPGREITTTTSCILRLPRSSARWPTAGMATFSDVSTNTSMTSTAAVSRPDSPLC